MVGDTDGLASVEVNPAGLLVQAYVLPATEVAPILIEEPVQIGLLAIVAAAGSGLTVIDTVFDFTQLLEFVSVSVYVVVIVGDADGLATIELNPAGLLVQI